MKEWPGAPFLSDKQWILLAALFRTLFWFTTDKNNATAAAWPAFIRSYLLLGEVGRHFQKQVTISGTVLLHLLVTWAEEHVLVRCIVPICSNSLIFLIQNVLVLLQSEFNLLDEVRQRVEGRDM